MIMGYKIKNGGLGAYFLLESVGKTNEEKIENMLRELKILDSSEHLAEYEDITEWKRGGAETYIARSKIKFINDSGKLQEKEFVAKAIVTLCGNLTERCNELMKRRETLRKNGALVSEVYTVHKATIYEKYLPLEAQEALDSRCNKKQLEDDLQKILLALEKSGAKTENVLRDMRSDGKHIYFVDYGEDLGDIC